jgi:hypothetical protein
MYLLVWHVICDYMLVFCLYSTTNGFGCKKYKQNTSIWVNISHIQTHTDSTYDTNTSRYCSLYLLVYAHMCLYLLVFTCIWWKNIFFKKWHIGTYNSACICLYDVYMSYVSVFSSRSCICLYVSVTVCMCLYPSVWACICLYHVVYICVYVLCTIYAITVRRGVWGAVGAVCYSR